MIEIEAVGADGPSAERMRTIPGVLEVVHHAATEGLVRYHVHATEPRSVLSAVMDSVTRDGARIEHVRVQEPALEDVFIALTGRALREDVQ